MKVKALSILLLICLGITVWARSETNMLRDSCNRKWELILSHDEFGNVTFGSKAEFRRLAMKGSYVKASVYMPDHMLQLPADNVNMKGEEVCVQALRSLAHNGTHLDDDFPLLFFMVCTTGHVTERDMRTTNVFQASSDWFVKDLCSEGKPIYSNYLDGTATSKSSLDKLHEAAKRMAIVGAMRYKPYVFPLHNVLMDPETGEVNGQSVMHVGQKYVDNYVTFHDVPYRWYSFWSTLGHRDNARWSLQGHIAHTHNADNAAVDWYADVCWRLIYSNDGNGYDLYGTVDDLINYIAKGHRVRVRYDDVTIEVSNLRVKNRVVTAQLLDEVSRVGSYEMDKYYIAQDTHNKITFVHTTGKVNPYEYPVGLSTKTANPAVRKEMEWMVDTRPWHTVLKTSNSVPERGSTFDLSDGVMAGASIRFRIVYNDTSDEELFIRANNARVDFVTNDVYGQALDSVSAKRSRIPDEFELPTTAFNEYYQVSSDGSIQLSSWDYGSDVFRSKEVITSADITWFANS